jgi:hypothetical protein
MLSPQSIQPAAAIPAQLDTQSSTTDQAPTTDAAAKLAEAIDDFLGDLEKKFKGISDEVLNKCEFGPGDSRSPLLTCLASG